MEGIVKAEVKLTQDDLNFFEQYQQTMGRNTKKVGRSRFLLMLPSAIAILLLLIKQIISGYSEVDTVALALILASLFVGFVNDAFRNHKKKKIESIRWQLFYHVTTKHEHGYRFYDDCFAIECINTDKPFCRKIPYDQYVNVSEWKDAFYLHAGNQKDFIIPKHSITEGTSEMLSSLFSEKLGSRFTSQI